MKQYTRMLEQNWPRINQGPLRHFLDDSAGDDSLRHHLDKLLWKNIFLFLYTNLITKMWS